MDSVEEKPVKLTQKQERFIAAYLVTSNATQSAIQAGYSKKTARMMGTENLAKPYIKEILQRNRAELSVITKIDATWVESQLIKVAEACMSYDPVDSSGANRALELLGKRFKMFVDKIALTDPTGEKPMASPLLGLSFDQRATFLEYLRISQESDD